MSNPETPQPIIPAFFVILCTWLFVFYENALRTSDSVIVQQLMKALHIEAAGIGMLSSSAYIAYVIFLIPAGLLLDRFSLRKVLMFAVLSVSVGGFLFSICHNLYSGILAQALMGLGSPVAFVACVKVIDEVFQGKNLSFWIGMIMTVITLGAVAGQAPFAAWVQDLHSWREAYFIAGIMGLLLLLFTHFACRGFVINLKARTSRNKTAVLKLIKQQRFWCLAIYIALLSAPITAFAALWGIPFMIQAWHLSTSSAASLIALSWIGGLFGGPLLGFVADYFNVRCLLLILVGAFAALIVLALLFCSPAHLLIVGLLLFILGVLCNANVVVFAIMAESVARNEIGLVTAATTIFDMGGGPLFQLIIGVLLGFGAHRVYDGVAQYSLYQYRLAIMTIPICLFVATFALLKLRGAK